MAQGITFEETQISSGVPERNVLQSPLFIVAVSVMYSDTQIVTLDSYADNAKVFYTIQNPGTSADLKLKLDALYRFPEDNGM